MGYRLIRDFMLLIGPVSSIFDFLTFYVLLHFFQDSEALFHTRWMLLKKSSPMAGLGQVGKRNVSTVVNDRL